MSTAERPIHPSEPRDEAERPIHQSEPQLEKAYKARIQTLFKLIGARSTKCNQCKQPIWLVRAQIGTRQFLDDATLHPSNCDEKPRQTTMFDEGDPTGGDR